MKNLVLGILLAILPAISFADECTGDYRCGNSETFDQPYRAAQPVIQDVGPVVKGSCDDNLPSSRSFRAVLQGVTCGEAAQRNVRLPLEVPKEVRSKWDVLSRSGLADAQARMQQIRQQDVKWSAELQIPMYESWTWQQRVGGYDASRCPMEKFDTTCSRPREEKYVYTWYTTVCDLYEDDEPSSPNTGFGGGGFSSGSGSSGYSGSPGSGRRSTPFNDSSPKSRGGGHGEDYKDNRKRARDSWGSLENEYQPVNPLDNILSLASDRSPSSQHCVKSHQVKHTELRWRATTPYTYSCVRQRPSWCTWPETRSETRACKNHKVKYDFEFAKDQNWRPGFVDRSDAGVRSYNDILPNRYDLLPGEKEEIFVYANTGISTTVKPKIVIKNGLPGHDKNWNEYSYRIEPEVVRCQFGMQPQFKLSVLTEGRIQQPAPNPLTYDKSTVFEFDSTGAKNRPMSLVLMDNSRETELKAAENSRNFPRLQGEGEHDPNALYQDNGVPLKGASSSGGYWQESRFKLQLFRKDKWGRDVRVTVKPESYSYDQIDVFRDTLTISLEGKDGTDRFYRPGGPMEWMFGRLYKMFNAELTPGREYFVRVKVVSRGLPFYESGCQDGKAICQGENGDDEAYSDALDIPFIAKEKIDGRSMFRRFKDWQEIWMIR